MDTQEGAALELLNSLNMHLNRGQVAYEHYIASGKKYLYAKILKDNNERIRQLIMTKGHYLPIEQQANAIDLVAHIDTWHALWEDLDRKKIHRLNDKFAFENVATFPKEAVASLVNYYSTISKH
jgi:hypothetical protein